MKKLKLIAFLILSNYFGISAQQIGLRQGYNFYPAVEHGMYGYINSTGQWMITPKFDWCDYFYDGKAIIREKGKYGFIDVKGVEVAKPIYDTANHFSEGFAAIALRNEEGELDWSYIDTLGKNLQLKIPALSALSSFSNGIGIGTESGFLNFFFVNYKGTIAFEAKDFYLDENRITCFSENLLHVYTGTDGNSTYIDTAGNLWGKGQFEDCGNFHDGLAWFKVIGKFGFINKSGEMVIPAQYDSVGDFSEGIALIKTEMLFDVGMSKFTGGHVAYIDKEGKKITPPIYSDGTSFNEGFAFVKYNGLYGFIDNNGKVVIDYQFEKGNNFFRGLAFVKKENHWEYINTNGNKVW